MINTFYYNMKNINDSQAYRASKSPGMLVETDSHALLLLLEFPIY